jgi:hypothetical protein
MFECNVCLAEHGRLYDLQSLRWVSTVALPSLQRQQEISTPEPFHHRIRRFEMYEL